ncbi:MAG: hypothetical protein IKK21_05510 [Clostridia bacterium]|nr:hypothetical protein [Clostridia bacterium]
MQTPLTKKRLRDHVSYCWWKYALLAIIAVFGWNIIYSITAYRPPEEKKIILGLYGTGNEANITNYMLEVQQTLLPEMEDMSPMYILPDETYGDMILMTRMAAKECDLYVLPTTQFQNWAAQGACMPLDEVLPEVVAALEEAEISLSRGRREITDSGVKHLYGVPLKDLPGAQDMFLTNTSDMYLCVFHDTGNDENVLRFAETLIRKLMEASEEAAAPAA